MYASRCSFSDNGNDGVYAQGRTVVLDNCALQNNGACGLSVVDGGLVGVGLAHVHVTGEESSIITRNEHGISLYGRTLQPSRAEQTSRVYVHLPPSHEILMGNRARDVFLSHGTPANSFQRGNDLEVAVPLPPPIPPPMRGPSPPTIHEILMPHDDACTDGSCRVCVYEAYQASQSHGGGGGGGGGRSSYEEDSDEDSDEDGDEYSDGYM